LRHVDTVKLPTNIDDAVIGLIDPAHVTFVHQSWFWRSAKSLKLKRKQFEPVGLGFRMVRHKPSANAKGYSILNGETSTEISFQLPGHRFEHILIGQNDVIVSITLLTPINETTTELNHVFYTMSINRIIISGNLVADPTLRETNSGTPVASATIANNEFFNDGDGERQQVTIFGPP
jgi:phenylpropionate dioxygenase-like ring-hydroxylating dioxygenase large terminal subunit